ncbi:ImmA/IrrE family metallo-endopeptidase [Patescibacteria group bacterium]|nr:ImmA/IrrE family metallo-endopeptidase [Patescibacteria group bacterium]
MHDEVESPRIGFARQSSRNILKSVNFKLPPVRLSTIIQELSKYELLSVKGLDADALDGANIRSADEINIYYNLNNHIHRNRFTVAHELGHFVLGHLRRDYILEVDSKNREEAEANEFAAELLMPMKTLKEFYKKNPDPKKLALDFLVSEKAMYTRLLKCGLLTLTKKSTSIWS